MYTFNVRNKLFYRALRQFEWIERISTKLVSNWNTESIKTVLIPGRLTLLEGCIEGPLQLCLQIFIVIAGQFPGNLTKPI